MARPPKIFISHSAHVEDDPVAADFLISLRERLSEADEFEVLDDRVRLRKELGEDWREALHMWMELCDGAVVLLNQRALGPKSWVRHEASLLSNRKRHDPDFPIIPILLKPVTLEKVKKEFAPQNLAALETVIDFSQSDAVLGDILRSLRKLHDRALPTSKAEMVELYVADFLNGVTAELLGAIARDELDDEIDTFMKKITPARSFARILIKSDLTKIAEALVKLKSNLRDKSAPLQVLNLLAGNWIDYEAVRPIEAIEREMGERRALAVNAQRTDICRMYVQRALGVPDESMPMCLNLIPVWAEDRTGEMVEQLAKHLEAKNSDINCEEARRWLTKPGAAPDTIFVCLPSQEEPDRQQMADLRALFPDTVFFVLTGTAVPEGDSTESARSGAQFLRPPIAPGKEDAAINHYNKAFYKLRFRGR